MYNDIKQIYEKLIQDNEEMIVQIPLKHLIWTICWYSDKMSRIEEMIFKNYPNYPINMNINEYQSLVNSKEYYACRRDELLRIISNYSNFDTQKIYDETKSMFNDYNHKGGFK